MTAGILTFQFKADQMKQGMEIWNATMKLLPQNAKGIKGTVLLTQAQTGKCLSIGFWENAADSNAFGASNFCREFMNRMQPLCVAPPTREQFDVSGGDLSAIQAIQGRMAAA